MRVYEPVAIARQFKFVRETLGPNRGVWVEAFQRIGDGRAGDPWCMDFASAVLWICYQGPSPLPRTGSCQLAYDVAKQGGFLVDLPQPNDVFFRIGVGGHAEHAGFVTQTYPDRIGSISGNTSENGLSRDGTGVFEHDIPLVPSLVFARLPLSP